MQTYLVRMRHPVELYRALGLKGFLGFQIVIGGFSLSSLVHPLFYLSAAFALADAPEPPGGGLAADIRQGAMIALFNISVLVTGYGVTIIAGMTAAAGRGRRPLVFSAFMMPAYWLLISLGAYKAMLELVMRPFHWEKTEHGISRMTGAQLARVRRIDDMTPQARLALTRR
jgi:hypothetical protein